MPFVVSEGGSINIGSQLVLTDADSNNSIVFIDRVYVEVLGGASSERLYFESSTDDMFGEGSGSDGDSLIMQPNSTVIDCYDKSN